MNKEILVQRLSDNRMVPATVCTAPSCPKCGVTLSPEILHASLVEDPADECENKTFILNFCNTCKECFISRHTYNEDLDVYLHESSAPALFFNTPFSENIKNLSPDFVATYNESAHAETLGMKSICGMGYRKALEFLVKDYVISNHPADSENISKLPLAQCISQYIDDLRICSLAKASAWLGNDETHYVKKHPTHGLAELKIYLNAMVTFIDSDLAFRDAQKLLSP